MKMNRFFNKDKKTNDERRSELQKEFPYGTFDEWEDHFLFLAEQTAKWKNSYNNTLNTIKEMQSDEYVGTLQSQINALEKENRETIGFSKAEQDTIDEKFKEHWKQKHNEKFQGTNSIIYKLQGTHIGLAKECVCEKCGATFWEDFF